MLQQSDAYKALIDAVKGTRRFDIRAKIYFDGINAAPTVLTGQQIRDAEFYFDSKPEDTLPFGYLALASFTMSIYNKDEAFTLTNGKSPYYTKMRNGICVDAELGLWTGQEFEYVNMGRFYTGDWDTDTASVTADITCYDRLYLHYTSDTPEFRLQKNISLGKLFEVLFMLIGIPHDDIIIDEDVYNIILPYGWFPGKTVKDTLKQLCQAGMCQVYVNRFNKVCVMLVYKERPHARIIPMSTIFSIRQPQSMYKAFTGVALNYYLSSVSKEEKRVASLIDVVLEQGNNEINNISFGNTPVDRITYCAVEDTKKHLVVPKAYGATGIDLIINATESDTADIYVNGYPLEQKERTMKVKNTAKYAETLKDRNLQVSSRLIQSKEHAKEYAEMLSLFASNPAIYLEHELRGDPAVEIFDKVMIPPDLKSKKNAPVIITKLRFRYDGGLVASMSGTRAEALEKFAFIYLGPGFMTKIDKSLIVPKPVPKEYVYIGPGFYTKLKAAGGNE